MFRHIETLEDRRFLACSNIDLNNDMSVDVTDLNQLITAFAESSSTGLSKFDLDGSGKLDNSDVNVWLNDAALAHGFGEPYRRGDANLDGVVDEQDLSLLAASWQTTNQPWSGGNFSPGTVEADRVDRADLNELALNWAPKYTIRDRVDLLPDSLDASHDNTKKLREALSSIENPEGVVGRKEGDKGIVSIPCGHFYVASGIPLQSMVDLRLHENTLFEVDAWSMFQSFRTKSVFQLLAPTDGSLQDVSISGGRIIGPGDSSIASLSPEDEDTATHFIEGAKICPSPSPSLNPVEDTNQTLLDILQGEDNLRNVSKVDLCRHESAGPYRRWEVQADNNRRFEIVQETSDHPFIVRGINTGSAILIEGNVNDVTIDSVSISGAAIDGIQISHNFGSPSEIQVLNCECDGNLRWGLSVTGGSDITVYGGSFDKNVLGGIDIEVEQQVAIVDVEIREVSASHNAGKGIQVANGQFDVTACDNDMTFFCPSAIDVKFFGNTVEYNGSVGIQANFILDLTIEGNVIMDNHTQGVSVTSVDNLRLSKNEIAQHKDGDPTQGHGIVIRQSGNFLIKDNTVEAAKDDGILVFQVAQGRCTVEKECWLKNNTLTNIEGSGIRVEKEQEKMVVEVTDNTLTNIRGLSGIRLVNGEESSIVSNELKGTFQNGITVERSSATSIESNEITGANSLGVFVDNGSSGTMVTSNIIKSSGKDGLRIHESSTTGRISGNRVSDSGESGINVAVLDSELLSKNTIMNAMVGINIESACSSVGTDKIATENEIVAVIPVAIGSVIDCNDSQTIGDRGGRGAQIGQTLLRRSTPTDRPK